MSRPDYVDHKAENGRLVILQTLQKQLDGRLNSLLIARELQLWGHDYSREAVRTQLNRLAELGAVHLTDLSSHVVVAELTEAGDEHLRRQRVIAGIERPRIGG